MASRRGLTLVELLLVVVVLGILTVMIAPVISRVTTRARVNEATGVVAADLEQTVGLAGRLRKPMTLSLEGTGRYVVKDRATSPADTVRLRRNLAYSADQGVNSLTLEPSTITIFPNGLVSAALTVTIASNGYSRQITLSPAGQVRVTP
jgi:prepilin-type N-terminal cleavage/methylation domain-containing protein